MGVYACNGNFPLETRRARLRVQLSFYVAAAIAACVRCVRAVCVCGVRARGGGWLNGDDRWRVILYFLFENSSWALDVNHPRPMTALVTSWGYACTRRSRPLGLGLSSDKPRSALPGPAAPTSRARIKIL